MSKGRKICIVGFSEVNREWAKEQPKTVEIWGLNEAHNCTEKLKTIDELGRTQNIKCGCYNPNKCVCEHHKHRFIDRYDRWFQIHPPDWNEKKRVAALAKTGDRLHPKDMNAFGRNERHVNFLKECDKPIYMLQKWGRFPNAIQYPFKEIERTLGISWNGRKYLYSTSSPSYMMALAIYEHLQGETIADIRLAGIELALGTEYFWQRPCMEYYIGLAQGMGIKVKRPPNGCSLITAPRYAIDDPIPTPTDYTTDPIPLYQPHDKELRAAGIPEVSFDDRTA